MTWKETLPCNRIELWIIRIFLVAAIFMSGVGTGYILNANRFQQGQDYVVQTYFKYLNK